MRGDLSPISFRIRRNPGSGRRDTSRTTCSGEISDGHRRVTCGTLEGPAHDFGLPSSFVQCFIMESRWFPVRPRGRRSGIRCVRAFPIHFSAFRRHRVKGQEAGPHSCAYTVPGKFFFHECLGRRPDAFPRSRGEPCSLDASIRKSSGVLQITRSRPFPPQSIPSFPMFVVRTGRPAYMASRILFFNPAPRSNGKRNRSMALIYPPDVLHFPGQITRVSLPVPGSRGKDFCRSRTRSTRDGFSSEVRKFLCRASPRLRCSVNIPYSREIRCSGKETRRVPY